MRFLRQHKYVLSFLVVLVFCSVMVVLQFNARQSRHRELREAFILLELRGYTNESHRLYVKLIEANSVQSTATLLDDFQRFSQLVDPASMQPKNRLWIFHWEVSKELDKRSESTLERARKLANEP